MPNEISDWIWFAFTTIFGLIILRPVYDYLLKPRIDSFFVGRSESKRREAEKELKVIEEVADRLFRHPDEAKFFYFNQTNRTTFMYSTAVMGLVVAIGGIILMLLTPDIKQLMDFIPSRNLLLSLTPSLLAYFLVLLILMMVSGIISIRLSKVLKSWRYHNRISYALIKRINKKNREEDTIKDDEIPF